LVVLNPVGEPYPELDSIVFRAGGLEADRFSLVVEYFEHALDGPSVLVPVSELVG
jgi:hypothetical protein